jgi:hypothetical protein
MKKGGEEKRGGEKRSRAVPEVGKMGFAGASQLEDVANLGSRSILASIVNAKFNVIALMKLRPTFPSRPFPCLLPP